MKKSYIFYAVLPAFVLGACSSGSSNGYVTPQYEEVTVLEQVPVKCSYCNGTGRAFDYDLGMSTMCMKCFNGYVYITKEVKQRRPVSFTGGANACTLCRSAYCSGYNGKKEMNAKCQNSSCGHSWQQHQW